MRLALGLRPQLLLCLDQKDEVGGWKNKGKERDWECDKNLDVLIEKEKMSQRPREICHGVYL